MHRMAMSSGGWRFLAGSPHVRGAAAVAAVGGSVAYVRSYPSRLPPKDPAKQRIPRPVMEAVCGAVGEVMQVCVFFPIETVKVRCQSEGLAAATVITRLLADGNASALRQLYRGFGTAAVLSCLVGAVHYASFCSSKRLANEAAPSGEPGGSGAVSSSSAANLFAASVGALATALVESPAEMLRHQQQAGMHVDLGGMVAAKGLPAALVSLYAAGFLPFLIESLPADISELGTYGALNDWREGLLQRPGSRVAQWMAGVPAQSWDLAAGAAAGAASVLVSMPFDVIKTKMQLMGTEAAAQGLGAQARAFVATGGRMVVAGGPGALFVGLAPRLLQQVPSTTLCWWAIERCRDVLEPYTCQ